MKKILIPILIIVLIVIGFFVLNNYIYNEKQGESISQEYVDLFKTELISQGVERVGQPIEGFDAFILMQAFHGLEESDFDLVNSFEGIYEYIDGELEYKRVKDQPITSAEKTISDDGYRTLLDNVVHRLNITINNEESVLDLINSLKLPLNETFTNEDNSVSFNYPSNLGTNYINTVDWPPQIQVLEESTECTEAGSATDRTGKTEIREVGNNKYCVTEITEGAAGSIYTQYAYMSDINDKTVTLTFSIRAPQCSNYPESERSQCELEKDNFEIDNVINRVFNSIKL